MTEGLIRARRAANGLRLRKEAAARDARELAVKVEAEIEAATIELTEVTRYGFRGACIVIAEGYGRTVRNFFSSFGLGVS